MMESIRSMFGGGQNPFPFQLVAFTSGRDIEELLQDPEVSQIVERQSESFYRLNVRDAMSNLASDRTAIAINLCEQQRISMQ